MKVSQPPLPCASMDSTKLAQVHQRLCGKWTGGAAQIWPWPPVQDSIARESERSATAKRAPYATARPYPTLPIYLRQKASPPSSLNILREISKKRKKVWKTRETSANFCKPSPSPHPILSGQPSIMGDVVEVDVLVIGAGKSHPLCNPPRSSLLMRTSN